MEYFEVLKNRRSVRKYTGQRIEDEKIDKIVRSAMMGATGKNLRPWEFIVVRDKEVLTKLSESRETGSAKMLAGADAAVIVLGDPEVGELWVEDCSIAMTNMYLTAEALGVGACWVHGRGRVYRDDVTTEDFVRELLGFPENLKLEAIMSLGYPAAHPEPRRFEDQEMAKVHWEKY